MAHALEVEKTQLETIKEEAKNQNSNNKTLTRTNKTTKYTRKQRNKPTFQNELFGTPLFTDPRNLLCHQFVSGAQWELTRVSSDTAALCPAINDRGVKAHKSGCVSWNGCKCSSCSWEERLTLGEQRRDGDLCTLCWAVQHEVVVVLWFGLPLNLSTAVDLIGNIQFKKCLTWKICCNL